jgi:hypothetical protein
MDIIEAIKEKLSSEIERYSDSLSKGGASSYEDYRTKTGYIRALRDSIRMMDDITKDYIDNN